MSRGVFSSMRERVEAVDREVQSRPGYVSGRRMAAIDKETRDVLVPAMGNTRGNLATDVIRTMIGFIYSKDADRFEALDISRRQLGSIIWERNVPETTVRPPGFKPSVGIELARVDPRR